jgi:hypothetical protein
MYLLRFHGDVFLDPGFHLHNNPPLRTPLFVFIIMFPFDYKAQDAADHIRDHPLLVRMNNANRNHASIRGNHASGTEGPE